MEPVAGCCWQMITGVNVRMLSGCGEQTMRLRCGWNAGRGRWLIKEINGREEEEPERRRMRVGGREGGRKRWERERERQTETDYDETAISEIGD